MSDAGSRPVDFDEVEKLVTQLTRDLERARAGGTGLETLRTEVEQLRLVLAQGAPSSGEVHESLHGVRERLHELGDELKSEALTGTDYVTRIGRLLGLG